MSLPASLVTIVGSAGPTMVWSSAPRNRPSRTAKRISIFARCGNPRAGSSSRLGVARSGALGIDSMWLLPSGNGCRWGTAGAARSGVVGVPVEVVGPDLLDDGPAEVRERREDASELSRLQPTQDRSHPVLLQGLDLVADPGALRRGADDDDAAVVLDAVPVDQAALRHPVDQTGGIAEG